MSHRSRACRRARRELVASDRGALSPSLIAHGQHCPTCRALISELEQSIAAARDFADQQPSRATEDQIWFALRRSLEQPHPAPRRWPWLVWAAVPAALAAFVLVWLGLTGGRQRARLGAQNVVIAERQGAVSLLRGGFWSSAPAVLAPGDTVRTGPRARAKLVLQDAQFETAARTAIRLLKAAEDAVELQLQEGSVLARIDPRGKRRRVCISAKLAKACVLGTVFRLTATVGRLELAVLRGKVILHRPEGAERVVSAGEVAALEEPGRASTTAPLRHSEPPGMLPGTRTNSSTVPRVGDTVAGFRQNADRKRTPSNACARFSDGLSGAASAQARALLQTAECYERLGESARALQAYRALAERYPSSTDALSAAYEVARLARQLGRREEALSAFAAYARDYPASALAPEAFFRACVLQRELGRPRRAIECLRDYRKRYVDSARLAESYYLEATIWRRELGDCGAALAAYNAYLRAPGELEREARRWKRHCSAASGPGK